MAPFMPFVEDYATLEKRHLLGELASLELMEVDRPVDRAAVRSLFDELDAAVGRCQRLTQSRKLPELLDVLADIVVQFVVTLGSCIRKLNAQSPPSEDNPLGAFAQLYPLFVVIGAIEKRYGRFVGLASAGAAESSAGMAAFVERVESRLEELSKSVHDAVLTSLYWRADEGLERSHAPPPADALSLDPTISLPTFSLSPSAHISAVGEHLLSLPIEIERATAGSAEGDDSGRTWLAAVADKAMARMYQQFSELDPEMSARQVATDVGYIRNVVAALGLDLRDDLASLGGER